METNPTPRPPRTRDIGPLAEDVLRVRVSYRDTDQMGYVYYANYLVYFEMARTELLRNLGRTYRECEEEGVFLPVIEAQCKYNAPAHYDDLLEVHVRVTRWTRAAIDFEYSCRCQGDDAILVTGRTRHAFTNREGRVVRQGHRILPDATGN
jgi:acyl-CoA thioester hydrolase